jgi:hypothetical protein
MQTAQTLDQLEHLFADGSPTDKEYAIEQLSQRWGEAKASVEILLDQFPDAEHGATLLKTIASQHDDTERLLLQAFRSQNWTLRQIAATHTRPHHGQHEPLRQALQDCFESSYYVVFQGASDARLAAIRALGRLQPRHPHTVDTLVSHFQERNSRTPTDETEAYRDAFVMLGKDVVRPLLAIFPQALPSTKRLLMHIFAALKEDAHDAIPYILNQTNTNDAAIQEQALYTLIQIKAPPALWLPLAEELVLQAVPGAAYAAQHLVKQETETGSIISSLWNKIAVCPVDEARFHLEALQAFPPDASEESQLHEQLTRLLPIANARLILRRIVQLAPTTDLFLSTLREQCQRLQEPIGERLFACWKAGESTEAIVSQLRAVVTKRDDLELPLDMLHALYQASPEGHGFFHHLLCQPNQPKRQEIASLLLEGLEEPAQRFALLRELFLGKRTPGTVFGINAILQAWPDDGNRELAEQTATHYWDDWSPFLRALGKKQREGH